MRVDEFILARVGEDEKVAGRAAGFEMTPPDPVDACFDDMGMNGNVNTPASRMLRECEAKRRIVRQVSRNVRDVPEGWCDHLLRHLAAIWSDHPDYDPAWVVD